MQRIVIRKPGGYSALEMVEEPDPKTEPGEAVIAVEAAGVNYADGIIRMGLYESAKRLHGYPITPGFEVAGRIAALGPGVEGWTIGEPAIGLTLFNGYASRLRLGVDARGRRLRRQEELARLRPLRASKDDAAPFGSDGLGGTDHTEVIAIVQIITVKAVALACLR